MKNFKEVREIEILCMNADIAVNQNVDCGE